MVLLGFAFKFLSKKLEEETNDDVDSSKTRTDLEAIYQEQNSIKYQIQCAVVFSATFLSTAYASFSVPSALIGNFSKILRIIRYRQIFSGGGIGPK